MAKAALSPTPTYRRKFIITRHAVERLRERRPDLLHRFDGDIGNLIDDAVAVRWAKAEHLLDRGEQMWLVDVREGLQNLFAIVKLNGASGGDQPAHVVVTVLDPGQVAQTRGRWKPADGIPAARAPGFATLGERVRPHLLALPPAVAPQEPGMSATGSTGAPAVAPTAEEETLPGTGTGAPPPSTPNEYPQPDRVVTWTEGGEPRFILRERHEAARFMADLQERGIVNAVIWRPVKVRVRVVVEETEA